MKILKNINQILDALKEFSTEHNIGSIDAEKFILENISEKDVYDIAGMLDNHEKIDEKVTDYVNLVFQLRNPSFALSNFVNILLASKMYEACYLLVGKIFVNSIGQIKYSSTLCDYTFIERFFDRFIEIVKNCDIPPKRYIPFVVEIINSASGNLLFNWRRPAIEFMQNFFNDNSQWIHNFLNTADTQTKYNLLSSICEFNTARGVFLIINDLISKQNLNTLKCHEILKRYKKETEIMFDKFYPTSTFDEKKVFIEILISFLPDKESSLRLEENYKFEKDEQLKQLISSSLSLSESLNIKSEKQFLYFSRRKIKDPQERSLGVVFDKLNLTFESGLKANNVHYSYIIELFKEEKNIENTKKLYALGEIFTKASLCEFAKALFDVIKTKDDILFAKWALRFVSMFHEESCKNELADFCVELFENGRVKEAKYLSKCLCINPDDSIVLILKKLKPDFLEANPEIKESLLEEYCEINAYDKELIEDDLLGEEIDQEKQTKRLFDAFVTSREFNPKEFEKNYIQNANMFELAKKLVWGEYKFSRLYNTFILKNGKKEYLAKTNENVKDITIKIVHSLDLDERTDGAVNAINDPLFEQFKRFSFDVKTFNSLALSVNQFSGMFVNVKIFCEYLSNLGFKINKQEQEINFQSLIFAYEPLQILTEVTFEKTAKLSDTFATLGGIYFYKLSTVLMNNGKAILEKSNALGISGIPDRFFDYCLTMISNACKKKAI